jgi:uncharacterized Ntn-hydrolase superfamily protein
VAVQSHFFSVGSVVSWAEAGVGAVATQSVVEPAYGPRGLELMREGKSAPAALDQLLGDDPAEAVRQVAMVDRAGRVAVHTGNRCIAEAGHAVGEQVSAQANIMERDTVPAAMVRAFTELSGDGLAERLLAALEAAEREGGDLRGRQSAAMVVVTGRATGSPAEDVPTGARTRATSSPWQATSRARSPSTRRRTARSRTTSSWPSGTASRSRRTGARARPRRSSGEPSRRTPAGSSC